MNEISSHLRPARQFAPYPPYNVADYLEAYFYNRQLGKQFKKTYIPIYWTSCYNNQSSFPIQSFLDGLDPEVEYFTVCQHDDAPREKLPPKTVVFSAGGNSGHIPIPLICSPIKVPEARERDIFCSFRGANTHPIRNSMKEIEDSRFLIEFTTEYGAKASVEKFVDLMSRSIFSLCPRGYGATSFRLYEAIQLGSIPVYIYDKKWVPENLSWEDFSVLVQANDVKRIPEILNSISSDKIASMQDMLPVVYEKHFTLDAVYNYIENYIGLK
jgi:hypothetical protein